MITIAKRFTFDAAHFLPCMPDGHKCRGMHGHTYSVELAIRGNMKDHGPAGNGILLDYDWIAEAWQPIHDAVDHKVLNEVKGLEMPSTENLVIWIFRWFYELAKDRMTNAERLVWNLLHTVRVEESSSTWCQMSKVEFLAFYGDMA